MTALARFKAMTRRSGACLLWTGSTKDGRYGAFFDRGRVHRAHRWIYEHHHGATALHVIHSCDTPRCVEIRHLRAGTNKDNSNDRDDRGRTPHGDRHRSAKVTDRQVATMRRVYSKGVASQRDLARRYQLSPSQVCKIINRQQRKGA